jgi:NADPH-dependent ferric siderophore reductase
VLLPAADGDAVRRSYTVRRHDRAAGEVDIDFVAHPGGVAAEWAIGARPGDPVELSEATGKFGHRPADEWLVLVGDAAALPAIGRIVEELAPGRPALVVGIVEGPAEEQTLTTRGEVEVRWVHAPVEEAGPALVAAVRGLDLPPRPGFLWACGEAAGQRDVRRYLRHELGLPASAYHTVGYWRFRQEDWEKRLAVHNDAIEPRIEAADTTLKDDEEFFDALDEIYDEVGL